MHPASDLMDAPVTTGSGVVVAHVEELLLNVTSGKLEAFVVRPPLQEGLRLRLDWKDVRLDDDGERLILIPGRTATKRLLIRASVLSQESERRVH